MAREQEVVVTVGRSPLSILSIIRMFIAWFLLGSFGGAMIGSAGAGLVIVGVILIIMWIAGIAKYYGKG